MKRIENCLEQYTTIPRRGGDIYLEAKRRGIYLALFTDPEGDSCFSIYQISWKFNTIYKHFGDFVKYIKIMF